MQFHLQYQLKTKKIDLAIFDHGLLGQNVIFVRLSLRIACRKLSLSTKFTPLFVIFCQLCTFVVSSQSYGITDSGDLKYARKNKRNIYSQFSRYFIFLVEMVTFVRKIENFGVMSRNKVKTLESIYHSKA